MVAGVAAVAALPPAFAQIWIRSGSGNMGKYAFDSRMFGDRKVEDPGLAGTGIVLGAREAGD
jgi:hypothetical protein